MGLPIKKLVVASNENDVLTRFFDSGIMKKLKPVKTLSPSMDIQVSSNFERLLFFYFLNNKNGVNQFYKGLVKSKQFSVEKSVLNKILEDFVGGKVSNIETKETIKDIYKKYNLIIDPHTAVGIKVGREKIKNKEKTIFLSTAHYGKFMDTMKSSLKSDLELPRKLMELKIKEEKYDIFENNVEFIQSYIMKKS